MTKQIILTNQAFANLQELKTKKSKKIAYKAVSNAIRRMSENLRHPSLNTHEFTSKKGVNGEKVFESYAQNNTPGAYRIFWHHGPSKDEITIISITPHP